jgi:hypothetical protein
MATQERYPTGNSAVSNAWTAGTGGNKWDEVDDPAGVPDDETTYMFNANANQSQLFTFTPFAISPSAIASVSVVVRSRKETSTSYNTRARLLVNGTAYIINLSGETTSYATQTLTWTTNPNTGIAWTEADVEGTGANPLQEFGVSSIGQGAGETIRVTQCYIVVDYTAAGGGLSMAVAMHHYKMMRG